MEDSTSNFFAVVIDNEVAVSIAIPTMSDKTNPMAIYFEKITAALSSNPTIVSTNQRIEEGYIWDGNNFNPPV